MIREFGIAALRPEACRTNAAGSRGGELFPSQFGDHRLLHMIAFHQ